MKIDAPLRDIALKDVAAEAARYERMGFDGLKFFPQLSVRAAWSFTFPYRLKLIFGELEPGRVKFLLSFGC